MAETGKARYIDRPWYDEDLRGFRQGFGGGWVTKVPHGGGMLYVNLMEAGRADYIRWLNAKRAGLYSLADDAGHPANVAKSGLLMRATFVNLSEKEFSLEWTKLERCYGLSLSMCQDLELLWTPVKEKTWSGDVKDEDNIYFETDITVRPGARKETYLIFRPVRNFAFENEVVHGLHIALGVMTVHYDFGPGFLSTVKGPLPVPFPFFNPDANVPNARAELEFTMKGNGFIVMPPLQSVRPPKAHSSEPSFITTGLTRIDLPKDGEARFSVEAYCAQPGTPQLEAGSLTQFRQAASGFRFPKGFKVTNPASTSAGAPATVMAGWEQYSYKEERAAREAWDALPTEKKIDHALALTCQADPEKRFEGIRIMARLGDARALPHLLKMFDDAEVEVARAARNAYRNIRGMSYEDEQRNIAEQKAFEDHIADIARREGRVTYITIRDSILSRTSINVAEGGEHHVRIDDSVVHRSGLGQKEGDGSGNHGGYSGPPSPDDYQERLALYEKALKAALKDGKITPEELRLLETLRKKYGISEDEHEMLLNMSK